MIEATKPVFNRQSKKNHLMEGEKSECALTIYAAAARMGIDCEWSWPEPAANGQPPKHSVRCDPAGGDAEPVNRAVHLAPTRRYRMVWAGRLPGAVRTQRCIVGHLGPDAAMNRPKRPEHVTAAGRHVQQVFCVRRFRDHPLLTALPGRK